MTASHAVTSGRRWLSRATCGSWTRSGPLPPPLTARLPALASSRATESAPGVGAHSQVVIAASTSAESLARTDARLRETAGGPTSREGADRDAVDRESEPQDTERPGKRGKTGLYTDSSGWTNHSAR